MKNIFTKVVRGVPESSFLKGASATTPPSTTPIPQALSLPGIFYFTILINPITVFTDHLVLMFLFR